MNDERKVTNPVLLSQSCPYTDGGACMNSPLSVPIRFTRKQSAVFREFLTSDRSKHPSYQMGLGHLSKPNSLFELQQVLSLLLVFVVPS